MKTHPLTESQLGMFLEWNADRATTKYNVVDLFRLPATTDVDRLRDGVRAFADLHPLFRARLVEEDGEVRWFVDPELTVPFAEADRFEMRPYDPFEGPMCRFSYVREKDALLFYCDFFHLIFDGFSERLFVDSLNRFFRGEPMPSETVPFADYAEAEPLSFDSADYAACAAEHRARFAGKAMTLPPASPSASAAVPAVGYFEATAAVERAPVDAFCRERGIHPNLFFEGAFARTLALYANERDAVFFTVNHGRHDPALRTTLGAFVKSVPVLAEADAAKPLAEYLNGLKLHRAGVYPFTHFCRDLGFRPGWAYAFQDGTRLATLEIDGARYDSTDVTSGGAGELPLVQVKGAADAYTLLMTCLPGRHGPAFLAQFLERMRTVIANFLAHPDARLGDIPVLTEAETADVLALSKGEPIAYDATKTIVDLVRAHATERPDAVAVVDADGSLAYGELDAQSDALAAELAARGVRPGQFVGLMLPRRAAFVVAALAVQKCGAGYVPMDADYPEDRLAYMLANSEAPVLVTTKALLAGRSLGAAITVVLLDEFKPGAAATPVNRAVPDGPAYMIYTSGSTGRPKGVVVPHRALRHLCAWTVPALGLDGTRRVATHPSFSFDASVIDIFPALAAGAALHIYPEELRKDLAGIRDYIAKNGIYGGTMSTQIGMALLDTYPDAGLGYLVVGGEKLLPIAKTATRIINGYGPTEFAVCSSYEIVDQSKDGDIPIGRAVPGTASVVVDRLGTPVPRGFTGELSLWGPQIADGYWRLPEKTASVFVNAPAALGGRLYRTGDLARYNADGKLDYLGRIDFQVKLRGFRIEIGEVEQAAKNCPGVREVAAEVKDVAGAKHLVLYYSGAADADTVKAKMAAVLTSYMVPDYFVTLDTLPMTPNGKIDRRRLPTPAADAEPHVAPETEAEKQVFALVAEVLKHEDFGVTQDLNRLGLTSLGAIALLAKFSKSLGVKLTMRQLVANPTVRALAPFVSAAASPVGQPARQRRPRRAAYPLTENQRGIYADWLRAPDTTQYNVPAVFRFPGQDPAELAAAAERVFEAHPVFLTTFGEKDGEIVQLPGTGRIDVPVLPLTATPDGAFFTTQMKPFAPSGERLARGTVYAGDDAAYLFLDIHHTIFDGASVGVFLTELMAALDGRPPAGESYTAFDAALDERDYLESELVTEDESWFGSYLDGLESTAFETSSSGAVGRPGEAGRATAHASAAAVQTCCRALGVTPNEFFLTAFTELLRRVGRSDDVLVNFVSAGRANPDLADTVGMFVKTLPVKGVKGAKTFAEAVRAMHASLAELLDRDRVSYVRLSEKLGVRPSIIFAFEGGLFDLPRGASLIPCATDTVKCPLTALVTPGRDAFELTLEYDRSLFSASDMEALAKMFAVFSENLAHGGTPLDETPLVTDAEAETILARSRGDAIEYDATRTVVGLIHANAIARPFATAVVDADGPLTYGELDARSSALAADLRARGVRPGQFVGLMLPRRATFVVAALAAQKCGAGYVPMDADYPADRLAYMLANSEAPALVTTHALFAGKSLDVAGEVVFADDLASDRTAPYENLSTPEGPAYMIYTSGSTGRPKGVVVPHRALRHLCAWVVPTLGLDYTRKIATHPSFSFDASVIDLFPALVAGGELHIYPEELRKDLAGIRDYISKNGIYGGTMSTQIGMTLLDTYPDVGLGYLVVGGEKLLPIAKTATRIVNGYGPTEFTVCSSYEIVDQSKDGDIPIGRPVPGTSSVVVDRAGQLLPLGFAGELALVGPQVADGYWRLPEKTASVFRKPPSGLDGRLYRTGDLARYNADGKIDYLGRIDFQVKLRGFRIEIGEIENCAAQFAGVKGVAAEVREVAGAKHLVLYYGADGAVDEAELKASMAAKLADYMVPDYFVRTDPLPMTPNGKIDRKKLPTPTGESAQDEYVEPANETERKIAAAYGEILKLDRFGATTDFFSAGGTSLIAIKAVVALQKLGLDVTYGDLFKHQTPRKLAAHLNGESATADAASAEPSDRFDFGAYDYTAIDTLLAATRTDLFDGFRRHSLGDVLLTGATGYLGMHVLRYQLEATDSTVYALVRGKRGLAASRRIDAQYVYYFGERVPKRFRDRLSFIEGDVTDDLTKLLVEPGTTRPLVIGTVINCAAMVKHYVADDAMDRVNVGGVENLVDWCEKSGARLVQTSTYSVGGTIRADAHVTLDERHLFVGQESDNDYVRTKFLAERAVLAATAAGRIRGKVMRLGNLMGRESDGEFQMNIGANAFINSLKSYKALGVFPLEQLVGKIEMSPIDRVAEAVVILATTPDDMPVFHPFNCYPLDLGAVIGAMNRRGFDVDYVSRGDFAAHVDALRNDPARAKDLQGILHYAGHFLEGRKLTPAANDLTTTTLYRLGFRWKPAEDMYLARFFEMLEGIAAFG